MKKLAIWLDADDLDGNFAPDSNTNSSYIDLWKDKSGNNKNATRNNYINRRPIYLSSETKSRGALKFDGSDDYMDLPDNSLEFQSFDLFAVGKFIGAGQLIGASSNARLYLSKSGSSLLYKIGETSILGPYIDSKTHIFRLSHIGTTLRGYLDGQLLGSANSPKTGNPQMLNIGSNGNGGSNFFNGHINEIIGFKNYQMTNSESQLITQYLEDKWIHRPPRDLNSTAVLAFHENQPVGTLIGEFNATDPDGDAITYHFVNGENNNSLFTLDTNGTLKTATTFDYESNASTTPSPYRQRTN